MQKKNKMEGERGGGTECAGCNKSVTCDTPLNVLSCLETSISAFFQKSTPAGAELHQLQLLKVSERGQCQTLCCGKN